tara:strand:+ start:869 stop:1375 length:507 start_codon:yes stop_codon:yes gene_type:complete
MSTTVPEHDEYGLITDGWKRFEVRTPNSLDEVNERLHDLWVDYEHRLSATMINPITTREHWMLDHAPELFTLLGKRTILARPKFYSFGNQDPVKDPNWYENFLNNHDLYHILFMLLDLDYVKVQDTIDYLKGDDVFCMSCPTFIPMIQKAIEASKNDHGGSDDDNPDE